LSDLHYAGKTVVVTGGATGVGAALLDLLAELGASDVTVLELLGTDGWDAGFAWFSGRELPVDTYSFTKEVVQVLTMKLCYPAAAQGVLVNSVCPSLIDTPLLPDFRKTLSDKLIDWCVKHAGGRLVTPREVASSLAWLGSPASSFVSSVNLNIDMGFGAAGVTGQLDYSELMGG